LHPPCFVDINNPPSLAPSDGEMDDDSSPYMHETQPNMEAQCLKMASSEVVPDSTPDICETQPDEEIGDSPEQDLPSSGTPKRPRDDHHSDPDPELVNERHMKMLKECEAALLNEGLVNEEEVPEPGTVHIRLRNRHGVDAEGQWVALDLPKKFVWVKAKVISVSDKFYEVEHASWNVLRGNYGRTTREVRRKDVKSAK